MVLLWACTCGNGTKYPILPHVIIAALLVTGNPGFRGAGIICLAAIVLMGFPYEAHYLYVGPVSSSNFLLSLIFILEKYDGNFQAEVRQSLLVNLLRHLVQQQHVPGSRQ